MKLSDKDFADIQGLVRFAHSHLKAACFFPLRIADAGAARAWLADATAQEWEDKPNAPAKITNAIKGPLPDTALQVAFTFEGLKALGLDEIIAAGFPLDFRSGMAGEEARSRRLGDVCENGPKGWKWGGPDKVPHVLVLVYAITPERLDSFKTQVRGAHWDKAFKAFDDIKCLSTSDMKDHEPFGFLDGVSQPEIDWDRQKPVRVQDTVKYTNIAALGEFLLGYPNEYARYTDRPLVEADKDPGRLLPLAEDKPGVRDFGRNGTYLVLRDLYQDVAGFWEFVDQTAKGNPRERRWLAHLMVGRMLSGDPIVPLSADPIAGVGPDLEDVWRNQFTFAQDPDGTTCPFGAHIRRANPRNADYPAGTKGLLSKLFRALGFGGKHTHYDLVASTRFHRILRRGREYGPLLEPDDAVKADANRDDRGLRFICLNANITRQFEFLQTSWINDPKFDGLEDGDPLLGNRKPLSTGNDTNGFAIPQESGLPRRIDGLPQFVKVRGGAYFFLPGISALRYLAAGGQPGAPASGPP
jgi:deferrochelatase/peroxidase EfeB